MARGYRVDAAGRIRFAANQTDAETHRRELTGQKPGVRHKEGSVSEVDLPESKSAWIPFLNELLGEVEDSGNDAKSDGGE